MPAALVIVWWGPRLAVLGPDGRLEAAEAGGEPAAALGELLAAEFPGARAARLLYQPDGLELHESPCPPGSRTRLRRLLAGDFPALRSRTAVWAAAPLRPAQGGRGTVLYLEPDSPLPELRAQLARQGVRIEGAWPLAALWDESPAAPRGFLGVAALPNRALVYCLWPAGDRSIRLHAGPRAAERAAAEIRSALPRFEEAERPAGALAADPGPDADELSAALGGCALDELPPADWFARARGLAAGGLGDLLAPDSPLAGPAGRCRIAAAAGALLLAGAAAWTVRRRLDAAAADRAWAARQAEAEQTEARVLAGESLRQQIDRLHGAWRTAQAPASRHYAFLAALGRAAGPAIVLQSLRIAGDDFEIRGRADPEPDRGEDALLRFRRALFAPGQPWRDAHPDEPPAAPGGDFVLRGSWAPVPAP